MNYVYLPIRMTYINNRLLEMCDNRLEGSEVWHFFDAPTPIDTRDMRRFLGE